MLKGDGNSSPNVNVTMYVVNNKRRKRRGVETRRVALAAVSPGPFGVQGGAEEILFSLSVVFLFGVLVVWINYCEDFHVGW